MSGTNGARFRVRIAPAVGDDFRRLVREAAQGGYSEDVLRACRKIIRRLTNDADTAGEPMYRFAFMRVQMRNCCVLPLIVYYGVSEESNYVFITEFRLMPPSP